MVLRLLFLILISTTLVCPALNRSAALSELEFAQTSFPDQAAINSAYKRLALSRHPDKGGSKESFQRLGNAKDYLLKHYQNANTSTPSWSFDPQTDWSQARREQEDVLRRRQEAAQQKAEAERRQKRRQDSEEFCRNPRETFQEQYERFQQEYQRTQEAYRQAREAAERAHREAQQQHQRKAEIEQQLQKTMAKIASLHENILTAFEQKYKWEQKINGIRGYRSYNYDDSELNYLREFQVRLKSLQDHANVYKAHNLDKNGFEKYCQDQQTYFLKKQTSLHHEINDLKNTCKQSFDDAEGERRAKINHDEKIYRKGIEEDIERQLKTIWAAQREKEKRPLRIAICALVIGGVYAIYKVRKNRRAKKQLLEKDSNQAIEQECFA